MRQLSLGSRQWNVVEELLFIRFYHFDMAFSRRNHSFDMLFLPFARQVYSYWYMKCMYVCAFNFPKFPGRTLQFTQHELLSFHSAISLPFSLTRWDITIFLHCLQLGYSVYTLCMPWRSNHNHKVYHYYSSITYTFIFQMFASVVRLTLQQLLLLLCFFAVDIVVALAVDVD